ncbi:GNAT family N-acetyltransferase [Stieleria marina]|uniref:GNAT family N-acetyltransferase n=1 Tax=Stieleria marina TaxID=1930275 RepID=UPI003AF3806A
MSPDRVKVVAFDDLTHDDLVLWEQIRATRPEFATPFFSARFNAAVHRVRQDVDVAVIQAANRTIGFLPFHRIGNVAFPAGRCFNDAHNIIARSDKHVDWIWLLEQIGVKAFDFHAMMGADLSELGRQNYIGTIQSFRAELGNDSRAFLKKLGREHKTVGRQPQKTRKMGREIGPVELEIDCRDPSLLEHTIRWKREQYQRTDILDLFTPDWTRGLLMELFNGDGQSDVPGDARGMLSVLRAGDSIVAAHYGILENGLLHYWFPAYDPAYGRYSPGTALFTGITAQASDYGIHCIDMGYGEQPYKLKQTDQTGEVAFGCVSRSSLYRRWRSVETAAITAIKKAPMKESLKRIWRTIQPNAGISKLR